MSTQDIGAARVHLIVDATDWEDTIERAKRGATGFGDAAEKAFENASGKARTSATRLLDYVSTLGRVESQFERYLRQAARAGVEAPLIEAAVKQWRRYQEEVALATARQEEMNRAQEEANQINRERNNQIAANAQRQFNIEYGVEAAPRSAEYLEEQARVVRALTLQAELREQYERNIANEMARSHDEALAINRAFNEQIAANAQRQFNIDYGVEPAARSLEYLEEQARVVRVLTEQAEARAAAEARVAEQISRAYDEAQKINAAFDAQRAENNQSWFNQKLGVGTGMSSADLAEQRRVVAQLTQQFNELDMAIDEAFAHNQAVERFKQQLENMRATAGKTHYEILQLKADQLGVGKSFAPMIQALKDQDEAMGAAGLTAKQYQWAMRGLPAQLTDITVGLMTGQTPWMVMLQQGGQLKDMFGGLGPAIKAVSGAVWAMVNPWTVGAATLGAFALAGYDAAKSMQELAIATAKGNGLSGTPEQLFSLAEALNELNNINLGAAEDAVARLASGGKLSGENLRLAAEATARWASVTGEAGDEVAAKFEAIAKGPLEAIESGQVRVTEAEYETIKALVEHGEHQDAVNELVRIYYNTMNQNSAVAEQHLIGMAAQWRDIKDAIGEATREVGKFFNFLAEASRQGQAANGGGVGGYLSLMLPWNAYAALRDVKPPEPTEQSNRGPLYDPDEAKRLREREQALAAWSATADKAAQRELTLNRLREEGKKLGQDEAAIQAVLNRQRQQWAEQDARASRRAAGRGNDGTAALREQQRAELAAIATQTKELKIQYQERAITAESYYAQLRQLADQELAVQMRSIDAQKAAVAGRRDSTQRTMQLEAEAAKLREQHAQKAMDIAAEERRTLFELEVSWRNYTRSLSDSTLAMERSIEAQILRQQMGAKEYERTMAISDLYRDQADRIRDIERQVEDRTITSEEGERRIQRAMEDTVEKLSVLTEGYAKLDESAGSAFNGMLRAMQDFSADAADVAAQTEALWSYALDGFVDSTADALAGSLDSFNSYFDNLHKMILQFLVKEQLSKFLRSLMGAGGEGGGSGDFLSWIGAFMSDNGTFFAKGGVPGGEGISAYRNQILNSPTFFAFAKGGVPNVGVAGEAGREAIMPLARTPSGDLGVRVAGNQQRSNTTINQTFVVQGTPDRHTRDQLAMKTGRETNLVMTRN